MIHSLLFIVSLLSCVTADRVQKSEARTNLGTAYLKEGNTPGAVQALRQAAALNPQNATAWERLALAYMASGAHEESEDSFLRSLKLGTSSEPSRVNYNYGLLLLKIQRYDEALEQFDITLDDLTYRMPAKALNSKGFTLYTLGRYDEAIETLTTAVRKVPKLCPARFHRGLAYYAKGDHALALEDLETVIQTCGEQAPGAYFHAAQALFPLNRSEDACHYLRTAAREANNKELSREVTKWLKKECGE